MQAQRITCSPHLLSTPDPIRFPLTSPFAADGTRLRPAAVYLRESERDQGVYSFETQYQKAVEVLRRYGFYVAMVRVDSKSGSKISRVGYHDVEEAVHQLLVEAVGVYMMARWGRRAKERLRIGEEFDRLGVDVYDAHRGVPDKPGLIRVIMAGVDEQYVRDLSVKAVDNMPKAARDGKHMGPTPLGYKRIYPQEQAYDCHVASELVEHEVYGPLVADIFRRYAEGWSVQRVARWLNSLVDCPNPHPKSQGRWNAMGIAQLLRRRVYKQFEDTEFGEVEWGRVHTGEWNHYQGVVIHAKGKHPWLVDRETWERVQQRLAGAPRAAAVTQRGTSPALLHGFLRCRGCGAMLRACRTAPSRGAAQGQYICTARERGYHDCREPSLTYAVAEAAVLRELMRLQGHPWQPQPIEQLTEHDRYAPDRLRLQRAIAAARADMEATILAISCVGADLSGGALAAFRARQQGIDARMRVLEAELAALPPVRAVDPDHLAAMHQRLQETEMADLLQGRHDVEGLRRLLAACIEEARIVERVGGKRTSWARAEVKWTTDLQILLEAGLLTLGPAPEPPTPLRPRELAADRARRYRARKRVRAEQEISK